jgi:hypothetical protein
LTAALPVAAEWLETDASGGFAAGTVAGYWTRRYYVLLLTARQPPSDRVVLVNGLEAWVTGAGGTWPLSTQHYGPDVLYPRGPDLMTGFTFEPWPRRTFRTENGTTIVHEWRVKSMRWLPRGRKRRFAHALSTRPLDACTTSWMSIT